MRRLMPTVRRFLIHTGQAAALATTAVLAMAAAPNADPDPGVVEASATPAAVPVVAVAEPAGPVMREIMFHEPVKGFAINSRYGTRHLPGEVHEGSPGYLRHDDGGVAVLSADHSLEHRLRLQEVSLDHRSVS